MRWDPYIKPGEKGKILIQVDPSRLNGAFERELTLITNDPLQPQVRIHLYGKAPKFSHQTAAHHL